MIHKNVFLTIVFLLISATAVVAELQDEFSANTPPQKPTAGRDFGMFLGGLGGGLFGFVAGASLGADYTRDENDPWSDIEGAFYVGSTVGALGLGLGVHLADHARGNGTAVVFSSFATGAAGIALLHTTENPTVLPFTVLAQLAIAMVVERKTSKTPKHITRSQRSPSTTIDIWTPSGAAGLQLRHSF